jgi:hypothetical protein
MSYTFERSSGYAGYRCDDCGTWVYKADLNKHVCPKPVVETITISLEEYKRLKNIESYYSY